MERVTSRLSVWDTGGSDTTSSHEYVAEFIRDEDRMTVLREVQ